MRTDRISTEAGGAVTFTGAGFRLPSRTRWRNWPQMAAGSGEPTSDHSERWERRAQNLGNRPRRRIRPAATWSLPSAVSWLTGSGTRTIRTSAAMEGISAEPIAAPAGSIVIVSTPSASSGSRRVPMRRGSGVATPHLDYAVPSMQSARCPSARILSATWQIARGCIAT